jgi:PleD family two-component response regulator
LRITAERLRRTMRTQDTAGRFGGDEFVVLVESAGAELTAAMLAERLTEVLREPAELEGGQQIVSVTASIGIAVGRYASADALLRDAAVALYFAKAAGKNRCAIFEASMNAGVEDRQVLIADDDEINRSVARALLAKRGLRATIAHNGLEAVRMAGERNYAAILMDCQMPELDGYEATRRIRAAEHGHRAAVIAMTAHSMPGDRERCLAAGMDDYLSKPVRNENLDAVLERWLVDYEPALRPAQRAARPTNGGGDTEPAGTGSSSQAQAKRSTSDAEADPGGAEEVLDQATVSQLRDTLTVEMRERRFAGSWSERKSEPALRRKPCR